MRNYEKAKIIGIGFNKTGTSSLGRVLADMGFGPVCGPVELRNFFQYKYKHISYQDQRMLAKYRYNAYQYPHRNFLRELDSSVPAIYTLSKYFRSFQDRPWNTRSVYSMLSLKYPKAKFILTRRNTEDWWNSVSRWLDHKSKFDDEIMSQYLKHLQVSEFSRQQFVAQYEEYNNSAIDFFKKDPARMLILDLDDNHKLTKLSHFLKPKNQIHEYPCENSYTNQT